MWRRRLIRAKSRKDPEQETQLAGELKNSRKELRKAIGKTAWDELLEGLNRDPWGRPYKIIMNKIWSDNINIGEKLSKNTMEEILSKLFPKDRGVNKYRDGGREVGERIPVITEEEMNNITKRAIKKVLGPRDPTRFRPVWWPKRIEAHRPHTMGCMGVLKQGYSRIVGK